MPASLSPVGRFFLHALLWLPLLFGIWYYMAIVVTWPVTWLTDLLLPRLLPETFAAVEQSGYHLDIISLVTLPGEAAQGELLIRINPLMYGYGVPLFTALLFATPEGDEGEKWSRWLIALAILLLVQAFGVSMEAIKVLLFDTGPEISSQVAISGWSLEAVALGYQLGYLILPPVAPIALWVGFHRRYLEQLAPGLSGRL